MPIASRPRSNRNMTPAKSSRKPRPVSATPISAAAEATGPQHSRANRPGRRRQAAGARSPPGMAAGLTSPVVEHLISSSRGLCRAPAPRFKKCAADRRGENSPCRERGEEFSPVLYISKPEHPLLHPQPRGTSQSVLGLESVSMESVAHQRFPLSPHASSLATTPISPPLPRSTLSSTGRPPAPPTSPSQPPPSRPPTPPPPPTRCGRSRHPPTPGPGAAAMISADCSAPPGRLRLSYLSLPVGTPPGSMALTHLTPLPRLGRRRPPAWSTCPHHCWRCWPGSWGVRTWPAWRAAAACTPVHAWPADPEAVRGALRLWPPPSCCCARSWRPAGRPSTVWVLASAMMCAPCNVQEAAVRLLPLEAYADPSRAQQGRV